jgi:hypothetical protein
MPEEGNKACTSCIRHYFFLVKNGTTRQLFILRAKCLKNSGPQSTYLAPNILGNMFLMEKQVKNS